MKRGVDLSEPIAVVGMGCVFPGAPNIGAFWQNILDKVDSIAEVPANRWDWRLYYDPDRSAPGKTYCKIGGILPDFSFDAKTLRIPQFVIQELNITQKALLASIQAGLQDLGGGDEAFNPQRTALIIGNLARNYTEECLGFFTPLIQRHLASSPTFLQLADSAREAIQSDLERSLMSNLPSMTQHIWPGEMMTGRMANALDLNGINLSIDASCASSLAAIDYAVKGLRLREFDLAISGGAEQALSPLNYILASKLEALSPDGCRPFDANANGFVPGEGAGVCVLKRLSDAKKDGNRIYASIRAIGSSSDGNNRNLTAPKPGGQILAIERAFEQLDYPPSEVGLLEAHATGTLVGDFVEARVATDIFGPYAAKRSIGLGSVKSQIGHLRAAAGVASLIKATLALHNKTLPPTINFNVPTPNIDWDNSPFFVVTEPAEWRRQDTPRRAHVGSHGFGGTNFHVALDEALN